MARRGALTAIQAALAGLSGGAAGYVRQKEMQREQDRLKAQEERQKRMDIMDLLERGGVTQAAPGESITGPVPSAVPMVAPQREAMAAALQTAGPRTATGSEMFNIGGTSILMPSKAQRDLQGQQRALDAAIQQAEATGAVRMRQEREEFDVGNRRQFEVYRQQYRGGGEYNPNLDYASLNAAKESQLGRVSAQQIAQTRASGQGATADRGALPSLAVNVDRLAQMDENYVRALRPSRVTGAAEAPLMVSESRGLFKGPALAMAGAFNLAAGPEEREYATIIRSTTDAIARERERGVLTDRDIARFQSQVLPLPNDDEETSLRKFNTLKGWATWLTSGDPSTRIPGESVEEFLDRKSRLGRSGR